RCVELETAGDAAEGDHGAAAAHRADRVAPASRFPRGIDHDVGFAGVAFARTELARELAPRARAAGDDHLRSRVLEAGAEEHPHLPRAERGHRLTGCDALGRV